MLGLGLRLKIGKVLGGLHALLSAIKARATTYENQNGTKTIIDDLSSSDLLDNASILLTPTAYSSAVLHSLKDGTSDSDFDVTSDTDSTRINENGIIEGISANQPKINYKPSASGVVANSGHILLEPQRENAVPNSVDFPAYQGGAAKDTSATITAPDGTTTADLLINNGTTGNYRTGKINVNPSGSGTATSSVFVKYVEGVTSEWVGTWFNTRQNWFNVKTGTLGTTDSSSPMTFESYPNGWYRIFVTQNYADFHLWPCSSDNTIVSNAGEKIYFWGTQKEPGDFATSYIPTSGSATTRTRDVINGSGNSTLINSTEGVLYIEMAALYNENIHRCISLSDGTTDDRITILFENETNKIRTLGKSNGVGIFDEEFTITPITDYHKIAVKYKANDFEMWIDGVQKFTDTSGAAPIGLNELRFDVGGGSAEFNGRCKTIAVYKEALSSIQLQNLTS